MNSFFDLGLKAGDRIILPKSEFRLVQHHAIYDGSGWFYENKVGFGVVKTHIADFFKTAFEITAIRRFPGDEGEIREALQRAQSLLGKPYDLLKFNCEHYADYVQSGYFRSKQLETVGEIVGIGLLLWAGYQIAKRA